MVTSLHPIPPQTALAARLRALRNEHWPGRVVQQQELAIALGVGKSSVSGWESGDPRKLPPSLRLRDIATFFATPRSLLGTRPRLLAQDLTPDEQSERDRLFTDLRSLRETATGSPQSPQSRNPWHFPDGAPVRIICGELPGDDRGKFASTDDRNYMALRFYADIDALIELFGHVRAENPLADVRHRTTQTMTDDDFQAHLVILGNLAWMQDGSVLGDLELPIRQVAAGDDLEGELFEVDTRSGGTPRTFSPRLVPDRAGNPVVEDIGLFVRIPSPITSGRTLTLCSGVFTRGVLGAVRFLSDAGVRDGNLGYLRERFGVASSFGILMRVPVHDRSVATPDLTDSRSRLYEFAPALPE